MKSKLPVILAAVVIGQWAVLACKSPRGACIEHMKAYPSDPAHDRCEEIPKDFCFFEKSVKAYQTSAPTFIEGKDCPRSGFHCLNALANGSNGWYEKEGSNGECVSP